VEKDDESVNGKSIMGLMMLAAGKGETIKIITDGADAEAAMTDLEELVSSGFGDVE
jgi:phosphocarrier protein